ncbi:50S ribosomal protein L32 [bacterium]|nr:50S ribosomal protein L32 [bacterium]
MAALPKRRSSSSRRDKRRATHALVAPALSVCPKCKRAKRPHFVCAYCGYYGKGDKVEAKSTPKK